ncbi:Ubiquitin-protein ligase E3A, partial [Tetrabaena socialis]
PHKYDFCFCKFPFMYDPGSKARILQMENQMSQVTELHSALFRGLFGGGPLSTMMPDMCPFLVLRVRRGPYLVQDTLIQIDRAKETDSLKKPLKVKFIGEEGVDEGGVAKEFFQLLVRALFNPDFGMFTADPTSHLHWFRPSRMEMDTEFELVGILIGLAIYNSQLLEFQFPSVLYKKLQGATVGGAADAGGLGGGSGPADAAAEAAPALGLSLGLGGLGALGGGLLSPTGGSGAAGTAGRGGVAGSSGGGSVGGAARPAIGGGAGSSGALGMEVEQEMGFGEVEAVNLLPGGGELPVTASNRRLYVELYVRHLLQDSIAAQFAPFHRGFLHLCSGAALSWFSPSELELLVCGSRQLALEELEGATQYDDGYTRESEPVRWFWEVAHALSAFSQKRLLFFVTGSDRVPIKGLGHLNPPFVISRAGAHSDRLPSAHTCFNHLLLPHYNSKEMLQERLELALQNAEGFGLM